MAKFNFLAPRVKPTELEPIDISRVRTRATAHDPYENLRGRDYTKARGLGITQRAIAVSKSVKDVQ